MPSYVPLVLGCGATRKLARYQSPSERSVHPTSSSRSSIRSRLPKEKSGRWERPLKRKTGEDWVPELSWDSALVSSPFRVRTPRSARTYGGCGCGDGARFGVPSKSSADDGFCISWR